MRLWLFRWLLKSLKINEKHARLAASGYYFNAVKVSTEKLARFDGKIEFLGHDLRRQFSAIATLSNGDAYELPLTYVYVDSDKVYMDFGPIQAVRACHVIGTALLTKKGIMKAGSCDSFLSCVDSLTAAFTVDR